MKGIVATIFIVLICLIGFSQTPNPGIQYHYDNGGNRIIRMQGPARMAGNGEDSEQLKPIKEIKQGAISMSAFPNPSSGKFNLSLSGSWKFPVQVKVWSVLGQEVFSKNVFQEVSELHLSIIKAGVYLIEATSGTETKRTRVVIE